MGEKNHRRVLLITSWFPADVGRRGLINELADAFADANVEVDVIAVEWREIDISPNDSGLSHKPGVNVYRFKPLLFSSLGTFVGRIVKWAGTSLKAASTTSKLLRENNYDVVIAIAPSAVWAPVLICHLFSRTKKYLIQWDFIPYHQRAMGLMSGGFSYQVLLLLERVLVRGFDVIGCMSPMNIEFLKKHYWVGARQKIEILPIWAEAVFPEKIEREKIREKYSLPQNMKIAVFGGTLSMGRGLDDVVAAAQFASDQSLNLMFLIIGRGPLEKQVRGLAEGIANIKVMSAIPRGDYLSLLAACDCGIVATQRDTGVPTFPSKTLDYFRAGIPVVASVESSTDFGLFLEQRKAGVRIEAGDHIELMKVTSEVCTRLNGAMEYVRNGQRLIAEYFNVKLVVQQILVEQTP